jgi:hypothetical protein
MLSQSGVQGLDAQVHINVQLCIRVDLHVGLKLYISQYHLAARQYTRMQDQYTQAVVPLCAYDMPRKVTTNDYIVL